MDLDDWSCAGCECGCVARLLLVRTVAGTIVAVGFDACASGVVGFFKTFDGSTKELL